jgi:hypothetical protein
MTHREKVTTSFLSPLFYNIHLQNVFLVNIHLQNVLVNYYVTGLMPEKFQ